MEEQIINCIVNQTTDWWSIIANIVMAVASVANLVIIIYIFRKEQKNNDNKEKKEEKKAWYESLGIRNLTSDISNIIPVLKEKTFDFYNDKMNQEEYLSEYKNIEDKLLKYKNEYLTIIDCLDSEKICDITNKFQEIQDELYDLMKAYVGDKNLNKKISFQQINIELDKIRKKIIKMSVIII